MPGLFPHRGKDSGRENLTFRDIFSSPLSPDLDQRDSQPSSAPKRQSRVLRLQRADWERLWVYKSTTHTPLGDIVDAIMTHYLVDIPDSLLRHLPKEKIDSSTIEAHSVRVDTSLYRRLVGFSRVHRVDTTTVLSTMMKLYNFPQEHEPTP